MQKAMQSAAPFLGMVMAEVAQVILMVISKRAMNTGMRSLIFIFYSNLLASLLFFPFLITINRRTRPALNFPVLLGFLLLGTLGCLAQVFGYAGINYSSPVLATTLLNLVPVFTFVFAFLFRMERLDSGRAVVAAKMTGTLLSVIGAFIATLYKGYPLIQGHLLVPIRQYPHSNWVVGGFFLTADCIFSSTFIIVQALVLKKYPSEINLAFFYFFFVAVECLFVLLIFDRDSQTWSLRSRTRLLSVLYSGAVGSAFQVGICTWCVRRSGPVFVAMFKPIGIVVAAGIGVSFFEETLNTGRQDLSRKYPHPSLYLTLSLLCSVIGGVIIVTGFYSVMWGKFKEMEFNKADAAVTVTTPLLFPGDHHST